MRIVGVTSCITGIAHTYMAAEALEQAAMEMGHDITIETQGSAGSTPIPQSTIDAADFCIFANDLEVKNRERFNGKPFMHANVNAALGDASRVISDALEAFTRGSMQIVGADDEAASEGKQSTTMSAGKNRKGRLFRKRLGQ